MLASDVLDAVRDRHPAFHRDHAPNGMVLRFLSQAVRRLHGVVMMIDADVLRVETQYPLPLADFAEGLELPENRTVVAVTAETTGAVPRNYDLTLVPAHARNDRQTPAAAVWQIGNVLYLRGRAQDWTGYGSIAVSTVPVPPLVLASGATIDLPDTMFEAVVDATALMLANRGVVPEGAPPLDAGRFAAAAAASEAAMVREVSNRLSGRAFAVRDVMNYY